MALIDAAPNTDGRTPPRYRDLYDPFTPEEMAVLPQLKRFVECYEGDKELRDNLQNGGATPEQLALLKEVGITFDIKEMSPMWERKELFEQALRDPDSPEAAQALMTMEEHPLLHLWGRFQLRKAEMYIDQRRWVTTTPSASAKYTAWRRRRIQATRSELGSYGYNIDHPSLAIELALGCSVGCHFCAFDAPKLTQTFDINAPGNRELFRGVSQSLKKHLGWSSGHALLYWSTEPADNPHYIQFMEEYLDVTGSAVCTATARADEEWVSKLLTHYRRLQQPWPRISVLTRSIMYKIMKRFTPEESRDMALLMQQKDGEEMRLKVPGGRDKMLARLDTYEDLREKDGQRRPEDMVVPQGSIACVSGFLINIIQRSIKVISPCYTTPEYRYGYRVFAEATFTDAEDFDRLMTDLIDRVMVIDPYDDMPMKFRDDLKYRPIEGGFQVRSREQVHECSGDEVYGPLGTLLHQGNLTYAQVVDELVDNQGFDPMMTTAIIRSLFDQGFLCEMDIVAPDYEADTADQSTIQPSPAPM